MVLTVQMTAVFVCNILNLECRIEGLEILQRPWPWKRELNGLCNMKFLRPTPQKNKQTNKKQKHFRYLQLNVIRFFFLNAAGISRHQWMFAIYWFEYCQESASLSQASRTEDLTWLLSCSDDWQHWTLF